MRNYQRPSRERVTSNPGGDVIALLRGGQTPFVLRLIGDYYELVGPCYVLGIMDGEAFPEDPREQDELE
jgi:hypothetical protein